MRLSRVPGSDVKTTPRPIPVDSRGDGDLTLDRRCAGARRDGQYRMRHGRLELVGTDLAFRITESGRLEAPGLGFSPGGER
jgi:hypothetical protein